MQLKLEAFHRIDISLSVTIIVLVLVGGKNREAKENIKMKIVCESHPKLIKSFNKARNKSFI